MKILIEIQQLDTDTVKYLCRISRIDHQHKVSIEQVHEHIQDCFTSQAFEELVQQTDVIYK